MTQWIKLLFWVLFWTLLLGIVLVLDPVLPISKIFSYVLLLGLPLLFLVAVFEQLLRRRDVARQENDPLISVPTEPLVLMGLGFAFLFFNAELIFLEGIVVEYQLNSQYPNVPLGVVSFPFGIAMVVLVASFAKAAWTHLNLEDGKWGQIDDYREEIWKSPFFSGAEFFLRVAILVLIVLLQKQIFGLGENSEIREAITPGFILNDGFNYHYATWLGETMWYGLGLFTLITLWLYLARRYNKGKDNLDSAVLGTASLAFPGLIICLVLKFMATGSLVPWIITPDAPSFRLIFVSAVVLYVTAAIVLTGMFLTIYQSRNLVRDFFKRFGSVFRRPASSGPAITLPASSPSGIAAARDSSPETSSDVSSETMAPEGEPTIVEANAQKDDGANASASQPTQQAPSPPASKKALRGERKRNERPERTINE